MSIAFVFFYFVHTSIPSENGDPITNFDFPSLAAADIPFNLVSSCFNTPFVFQLVSSSPAAVLVRTAIPPGKIFPNLTNPPANFFLTGI